MGFSKTPYEQQREQQERAIKAQRQAAGDAAAMQAWSSLADMDTVTPEAPLAPTHDWQHSADTAAKHASGVELQTLEGKQKLDQIAATGAQHRLSTMAEYATKAKYAPKRTGGGEGPVSKLEKEFWKTHEAVPENSEQAERLRQRKAAIVQQLQRLGPGGRGTVSRIEYSLQNPYGPGYGQGTKRDMKDADAAARYKAELDAANARAEKAETDRQLAADTAYLHATNPGSGMPVDPQYKAGREAALARIEGRANPPKTSTGRASAPAKDLPANTPGATGGLPADAKEVSPGSGVYFSESTKKYFKKS
jgi:hypothetical protein